MVMVMVVLMVRVMVIIFVIIILLAVVVVHWARCCQPCLCHLCRLCCGHLFIAAAVSIRDYCSDWVIRLDSSHPSFHLVIALCRCCGMLLISFGFELVVAVLTSF